MNLIGEYQEPKKQKNSSIASKIILISIIILTILLFLVMFLLLTIKKEVKTRVILDGDTNAEILDMIIVEEEETYIPIRDIAKSFNYNSYSGDYIEKSEDNSKCYVESENEIAIFSLNSNRIYKAKPNETEYEYYDIDKPVKSIGGKLYTTIDGISKAFNVDFSYNKDRKEYKIQTMNYLITELNTKMLDIGYKGTSEKFEDMKSVFENILIVQNEKNKYGLYNISTNKEILEVKYDEIQYIPTMQIFLTKTNNKYGIVSKTGEEYVKRIYDDIKLIDKDLKLFIVKNDSKYGIINLNGSNITQIDYDSIGIDNSKFKNNEIKSKYILIGNLIPVVKDKLYGLIDVKGNVITECKYDRLGYTATNKEAENLLIIPEYNVIIACKDKKYILINSVGEELWNGNSFDEVYMKTEDNAKKYYLVVNDRKYDAIDQLERIGVKPNQTENKERSNDKKEEKSQNNTDTINNENRQDNEENENDEGNEDVNNNNQNNQEDDIEGQNEQIDNNNDNE